MPIRNKNMPLYKALEDVYNNYADILEILPFLARKRVNAEVIRKGLSNRDDL